MKTYLRLVAGDIISKYLVKAISASEMASGSWDKRGGYKRYANAPQCYVISTLLYIVNVKVGSMHNNGSDLSR